MANSKKCHTFMTKNVAPRVKIDLGPQISKFKRKQKTESQYQTAKEPVDAEAQRMAHSALGTVDGLAASRTFDQGLSETIETQTADRVRTKESTGSYNDGKKVYLTGSTTRNEKNWQSHVFAGGAADPSRRKYLGKEAQAKQLLSFDKENGYQKKSNYLNFRLNRPKSSADFLFDRTFDASKKANQEFYGAKANQFKNTSKFKLEEMISPNADWANPQHQPLRNSKNLTLGVGVLRRGGKPRVSDSHMHCLNNFKPGGVIREMGQYLEEMEQAHATERIYPSTEWTSSAARSVPSNVKSKVSAYDRKQKDLQGNNVLEKTDYAGFAQLRSKNVDVGELRRKMAGTDQ